MNIDLIFKLLHIAEAALKFPEIRGLHDQAMFALKQAANAPNTAMSPVPKSEDGVAPAPGAFVRRAIPDTEKGDD